MSASDLSPPVSTSAVTNSPPSSSDSSSQLEHFTTELTSEPSQPSPSTTITTPTTDVSHPEPERHPKGKRKRTAAKDKTILENAYLANAKPDKAARLEIVKRVSLNEKEVQIWFQNRRQNDRRKSRPLSAQEIAAIRNGGMVPLSSDPLAYSSSLPEETTSPAADCASTNGPPPMETPVKPAYTGAVGAVEAPRTISPSISTTNTECKTLETPSSQLSGPASQPQSASFSFSSSIGFLSNRWNPASPFSTPSTLNRSADDTPRSGQCPPSSAETTASAAPILPPPQSHVRLSLSLEGKAELVSNEASPPRLQSTGIFSDLSSLPQVRSRPFQRSHSALPSVTLPPISALTDSLPPTMSRGRSRDAHAWELCCDADTRDELTAQAENESNGSAVAAISLLRSTSGVLQNNNSKRNSPASRSMTRSQQAKKPKLSRTSSSAARIQTPLVDVVESVNGPVHKTEPRKLQLNMLLSPSGDSDKENWLPDDEGHSRRVPSSQEPRRPIPTTTASQPNARRTGRVLQDHPGPVIFSGNRARTMPAMGRRDSGKDLSIFEDEDDAQSPKPTDEVERFMRGEVSPSKKGDMDCIAGLLSLSQGNWR
ncbi:homeobox transcription factor [Colletotrichum karsti]|uniref:Homeobox transcription factor n=1 Tax=Colletotrichum karsti TaxID=1095194 RepID=A0A9P6HW94_9PEZI|nr:homeobox transcription factor [Colletotrichum karsti]KAF9869436.1 homeobox transcription factor [Colletotrichum karsti]